MGAGVGRGSPLLSGCLCARRCGRACRIGRCCAAIHGRSPGRRQGREPLWNPSVAGVFRPQSRLRRVRAGAAGQCRSRLEADESSARDRRGTRLRAGRAGRELLLSVRRIAGSRREAVDLDAGAGLGERHRQRSRARCRVHAVRRSCRHHLRHGGGPCEWRGRAHRHGRRAGQPRVADFQVWLWSGVGRPVHAVELRDRHEDGRVADASARGNGEFRDQRAQLR